MIPDNYVTPLEKRQEVELKFFEITEPYITDYPTSSISWYKHKYKPIIHEDILKLLPQKTIEDLRALFQDLEP